MQGSHLLDNDDYSRGRVYRVDTEIPQEENQPKATDHWKQLARFGRQLVEMDSMEKKSLPSYLQKRDRGFMSFPKAEYMNFLMKLEEELQRQLTSENLAKHPANFPQV